MLAKRPARGTVWTTTDFARNADLGEDRAVRIDNVGKSALERANSSPFVLKFSTSLGDLGHDHSEALLGLPQVLPDHVMSGQRKTPSDRPIIVYDVDKSCLQLCFRVLCCD
jgi:hypothetical protein